MNKKSPFWERLNSLIKQSNTTQSELTEKCGFDSPRRIQNLSAGDRLPNCEDAVKIAKALNTTVEYLVTGDTGKDIILSPDENVLLSAYRKIPKAYKRMALKLVIELTKADDPGDDFLYFDVSSDNEDKSDYNNEPPIDEV